MNAKYTETDLSKTINTNSSYAMEETSSFLFDKNVFSDLDLTHNDNKINKMESSNSNNNNNNKMNPISNSNKNIIDENDKENNNYKVENKKGNLSKNEILNNNILQENNNNNNAQKTNSTKYSFARLLFENYNDDSDGDDDDPDWTFNVSIEDENDTNTTMTSEDELNRSNDKPLESSDTSAYADDETLSDDPSDFEEAAIGLDVTNILEPIVQLKEGDSADQLMLDVVCVDTDSGDEVEDVKNENVDSGSVQKNKNTLTDNDEEKNENTMTDNDERTAEKENQSDTSLIFEEDGEYDLTEDSEIDGIASAKLAQRDKVDIYTYFQGSSNASARKNGNEPTVLKMNATVYNAGKYVGKSVLKKKTKRSEIKTTQNSFLVMHRKNSISETDATIAEIDINDMIDLTCEPQENNQRNQNEKSWKNYVSTAVHSVSENSDVEMSQSELHNDDQPDQSRELPLNGGETDTQQQSTTPDVEVQLPMLPIPESDYFDYPLVEVGRRLWESSAEKQHYTKGCIVSPDGTCVLVPVNNDGMHVIDIPQDLFTTDSLDCARAVSKLDTAVHVKEGGTVYDVAWYPYMNSLSPETCFWLATRQHEPIHMWDAFSGELRCSYRGYDDVDEVETAIALAFSNDAQKLYGGYKKNIKVFDVNVPGRTYDIFSVKQPVSCFAIPQNYSTITTGSWNGYIHHYDLRQPKFGALFTLCSHKSGVTLLRYTQNSGNEMLYSGARKDNHILQWDMRNFSTPVQKFSRNVATNQRIYFDFSHEEEWLISGDTSGYLNAWNIKNGDQFAAKLHQDCCNCVTFHPSVPIIASSSGQYQFADVPTDEELTEGTGGTIEKLVNYENALVLLWYGKSNGIED